MKNLKVIRKNHKGISPKIRLTILSFFLIFVLALPMFGQNAKDDVKKTEMKKNDMKKNDMSKMDKPTFETTKDGLIFKVWLMTQVKHKEMMNGMMGMKNMEMNKATKEAMMAGTHHLMLDVSEVKGGKEATVSSAKVEILSPTKKNSIVDLKAGMMKHFGSGLTLNEKGEYQLTVSIIVGGVSKTAQFKYTVK